MPKTVIKRDGESRQSFDIFKIQNAIRAAWAEVGEPDDKAIAKIASRVAETLPDEVGVEEIQDAVEVSLMRAHRHDVARAFICYRQRRAELRGQRETPDPKAISDYIHAAKYARHIPELHRREVYEETVARDEAMHIRRFPELESQIREAFDFVRAKRVLPSMRSMQFGGIAIEANHLRGYNCSASLIDRPRVFAELLYLLLCGCGTGYSVQFQHVEKLPEIAVIDETQIVHHVVGDSIEGWADALDALVRSCMVSDSTEYGKYVEFAYHLVRDAGAPLKTSGGKAPGHRKLKESLERIRGVLYAAQGRQLRPIECHTINCHSAAAVLSGGIRRSAMICLFSPEDGEMMNAKADASWFERTPWFQYANNSAVLVRATVTREVFQRIFKMTRKYGEPGIMLEDSADHARNPCAEVGLDPILVEGSVKRTGWAFCNLTTINAGKFTSREDFLDCARAATFIGTLQATYTDFPYLGEVSEKIARRDALIGVSMTGMQDVPEVALDPALQHEVALKVVEWNREFAILLGINPAARTTTLKPEGTGTMVVEARGSGVHPSWARRYIRRVTANEHETVFRAFRAANPVMCVRQPDGKWSVEFPVEVPQNGKLRDDFTALGFLEMVRSTQQNWVVPGTARESAAPGLRHNVSNTVNIRENEWDAVEDYLWKHRDEFTGVSFLPYTGDTAFPFAPFEAVVTEAQESRWRELVASYRPVDYLAIREDEDTTAVALEPACAGGACEWAPST